MMPLVDTLSVKFRKSDMERNTRKDHGLTQRSVPIAPASKPTLRDDDYDDDSDYVRIQISFRVDFLHNHPKFCFYRKRN